MQQVELTINLTAVSLSKFPISQPGATGPTRPFGRWGAAEFGRGAGLCHDAGCQTRTMLKFTIYITVNFKICRLKKAC